ncbi:hypothetical protein IRP63_05105 [Clostridium botulinum]|uniref:Uncharacterized protein n=1 Tax=Clostridium botulinum C/D str. DC5 TaxID=1443128 RepID=A0A0A0ILA9_CLOBO|nr:hypothetical protein [Clostridium botulinum]KEI01609.1 hypothetical protein Z952_12260 [Clostridium botulinum C/D str. BKT75002]KEI07943.1 hypothetical protein Z954_03395 [Clostridium botulinum C/D str. BKT2873]KGM94365.1 hypothetical protein Z956_07550 [Clostridium botulinum D str. CCUG 7971]KGN00361.1 hypothetical protein Z955_04055 [Clostridium botulinum C/D str. DC5]KOC50662.1 hypothetical protein ADU88_01950 [Clostridium botulinum]
MILSSQEKEQMKNYVINSLIEKYNYAKDKASDIVNNSSLIEELEKDPAKILYFDSEFWASRLSARSKLRC